MTMSDKESYWTWVMSQIDEASRAYALYQGPESPLERFSHIYDEAQSLAIIEMGLERVNARRDKNDNYFKKLLNEVRTMCCGGTMTSAEKDAELREYLHRDLEEAEENFETYLPWAMRELEQFLDAYKQLQAAKMKLEKLDGK